MWAQSVNRIFSSDGQNIEKLMKEFEDTLFEVSQPLIYCKLYLR
jgi:hypothetical protein